VLEMEDVGIKVIFESEVAKAQKNTQDFEKTMASLGAQAMQTTKQFGGVAAAVDKAGTSAQKLTRPVANASGALTGLTRVVQDAPFGFIAIGNNISETLDRFSQLSAQAGGAGGALKALGASMLGAGGAVFAVNLAITGVTTLVQKYGSLGAAIDAILNPLNEQARIQKTINDTMLKGAQDAQKELVSLEALYNAATNVNVPLSERNKIVDELQKKYPNYLGNLSNEAIMAGNGAEAYEKLRNSIIAVARAKAVQNKIAELSADQLENDVKREQALDKLTKAQAEQDRINKQAAKSQPQSGIGQGAITALDQLQSSGLAAAAAVGNASANLADLRRKGEEIEKTIQGLVDKQRQLSESGGAAGTGLLGAGTAKAEKKIKTISDVLKELEKDLTSIDVQFAAIGGNVRNLPIDKIKAFEKAVGELSDLSVRPGDKIFDNIQEQIRLLQTSLAKTPVTLKIPIVIEPLPKVGFNHEVFRNAVKGFNFEEIVDFEEEIKKRTNNAFKSGATNIASGIAEAAANIAAGKGSLNDALKGVLGVFANFIKQMGEALIASGTAMIAAKILIKNPFTAVAAGVVAVAAGAALQAAINKAPSFATGGIVNAPTLAMIGDNPGRREAIVPSEDWREAFGGGLGNGFIAETRLRGQDLYILVKKAAAQQGRVN
jgi:hypothetical protein